MTSKFLDGTPVPDDYLSALNTLVLGAAQATEFFTEDELEAAADAQKEELCLE